MGIAQRPAWKERPGSAKKHLGSAANGRRVQLARRQSEPRMTPRSELLPTGMLCTATLRGSTPGLEELGAGLKVLSVFRPSGFDKAWPRCPASHRKVRNLATAQPAIRMHGSQESWPPLPQPPPPGEGSCLAKLMLHIVTGTLISTGLCFVSGDASTQAYCEHFEERKKKESRQNRVQERPCAREGSHRTGFLATAKAYLRRGTLHDEHSDML